MHNLINRTPGLIFSLLIFSVSALAQDFTFTSDETVQVPNYSGENQFHAYLTNTSTSSNELTISINDSQLGNWGLQWCWFLCFAPGILEASNTLEAGDTDTIEFDIYPSLPQTQGSIIATAYSQANPSLTISIEFIVSEGAGSFRSSPNSKLSDYRLEGAYPNPFNPHTSLAYLTGNDAYIELSIYNLLGQKVRTLVSGFQSAGHYEVNWDGRDDQGFETPASIYFVSLNNGTQTVTEKIVKID